MYLTIAIPTYRNTKEQLLRCFCSLSGICQADILVCIDDESQDYNKLVKDCICEAGIKAETLTQKNRGTFHARRNLVNNTKTSWIFFLDADDYFTPQFIDFVNTFKPNYKNDLYTTKCQVTGEYNNFKHADAKNAVEQVESGKNGLMWGKFIKTELIRQTYSFLPEYPCGLFLGEEVPQTHAFKYFKSKTLNIQSICYTDEGTTAIKVITDIVAWKKMLSMIYLVDWYGTEYIKKYLTERLKTVDVSIGKQAISLLRRAMNKAELAEKIFLDNQRHGKPVHQTALELFGNSDPLKYSEVLDHDFKADSRE